MKRVMSKALIVVMIMLTLVTTSCERKNTDNIETGTKAPEISDKESSDTESQTETNEPVTEPYDFEAELEGYEKYHTKAENDEYEKFGKQITEKYMKGETLPETAALVFDDVDKFAIIVEFDYDDREVYPIAKKAVAYEQNVDIDFEVETHVRESQGQGLRIHIAEDMIVLSSGYPESSYLVVYQNGYEYFMYNEHGFEYVISDMDNEMLYTKYKYPFKTKQTIYAFEEKYIKTDSNPSDFYMESGVIEVSNGKLQIKTIEKYTMEEYYNSDSFINKKTRDYYKYETLEEYIEKYKTYKDDNIIEFFKE